MRMARLPLVLASLLGAGLLAAPAARAQKACGAAALIAGDPKYGGSDKPRPTGTDLRTGPMIGLRSLIFRGSQLFTNDGQEIWVGDLREGQIKRIAGQTQPGFPKLKAGPCADARFMNIHGMTQLPDGSLVAADFQGHALLKITDPNAPSCTVAVVAGTNVEADKEGKKGDVDGPGASAKLGHPQWPVSDDEGNVYFYDFGANKLKKLAADAEHTVSTVTEMFDNKGYGYTGLTILDDKVYVVGNTFSNALIFEVDPISGVAKKIVDGGAKIFKPLDMTTAPTLSSVTNDGKSLIVTGQGYIWRVTTKGKISHIAGMGSPIDFPSGYDPKTSHPAKKTHLRFRNGDAGLMGTTTALAWQNGVLFWRARAESPYIMSIGGCN